MKLGRWFWFSAALLAAPLAHASATNWLAKLAPVAPFPAVCAAASACGISLTGLDPATTNALLVPGDAETGLITLREKKRCTQWLINFQSTTNPPSPDAKPGRPMVLYSSTGHRYEFPRSPAGIHVRILGPFQAPTPRRRGPAEFDDKSAQVFVNQTFLGLGLDAGAAAIQRWTEAARQEHGTNFVKSFYAAPHPYGSARTNHDSQLAAHWHVTPDEERAVVCWDPALDAYFNVVGETPNLEHILLKVLSLPSVWSFIRNVGVKVEFGFDNDHVGLLPLTGWGLPADTSIYALPMLLTINKHPSLAVTMLVTAPHPPLLVSGGVIGFLAENPSDEENYLTLRIISAHCRTVAP